jgi:hypothetical protein
MPYSVQTKSSLDGSFKQVHLPRLEKAVPEGYFLTRETEYVDGEKLGAQYRVPVYLTMPAGATFAASDSAPTLNAPIAAETKEMTFDAYQIILRERVSYDAADRMASSTASYVSATGELPDWLRMSHTQFVESLLWYGQHADGLGTVGSISSNTLTITTAQWASGIWAGRENARLDVYTSSTFVKTVQITSVDLDSGTITVDSAIGITAGDALHWSGSYNNTFRGLHDIVTESTSQFGINPSTYNLLKGCSQSAGSATLKFKTVLQGLAKARAKTMEGSYDLFVNEFTFVDLVDEVEAARTDPQRKSAAGLKGVEIQRGADNMTVISPMGVTRLQVSNFVKKGLAFGRLKGVFKRMGTSDITFNMPGGKKNEEFFMHLQDVAGYELRSWSNFAHWGGRIGPNVVFTNINNSIDGGL